MNTYTKEQVLAMDADQLDAVMEEVRGVTQDADTATLQMAADCTGWVSERREALKAEHQRQLELRAKIASGEEGKEIGPTVNFEEERKMTYTAASPEYRTAFFKNLALRNGVNLFGEMNKEERDAFTFTTANTGAVVPTVTLNRIVELVESQAPMYADATKSQITEGFRIPRHAAIVAGDAAATNEGVANDDEQDTFNYLDLVGVEIKKHLVISRKMKWQSIDAFMDWVETHIAARIAVAKELIIKQRLDAVATGIAAANKVTVTMTDAGIRSLFAKLRGQGAIVLYANANVIWNGLAGVADGQGAKAFIPSPQVDPVVQGRVYGATVKLDNNLADTEIYLGIPRYLDANDAEMLFMNHAMDPKTFEDIVAGYSLFDAGLEHPLSWVKATISNQ